MDGRIDGALDGLIVPIRAAAFAFPKGLLPGDTDTPPALLLLVAVALVCNDLPGADPPRLAQRRFPGAVGTAYWPVRCWLGIAGLLDTPAVAAAWCFGAASLMRLLALGWTVAARPAVAAAFCLGAASLMRLLALGCRLATVAAGFLGPVGWMVATGAARLVGVLLLLLGDGRATAGLAPAPLLSSSSLNML